MTGCFFCFFNIIRELFCGSFKAHNIKVFFRVQLCVSVICHPLLFSFVFVLHNLFNPEVTKECQIMVIIRLYKKNTPLLSFFYDSQ